MTASAVVTVVAVVVTYHADSAHLMRLLPRLASQVAHIVCVDNTDAPGDVNPPAMLTPDAHTTVLRLGHNVGIAHAQNLGIAHARTGKPGQAARDADALHAIAIAPATMRVAFGNNNDDAVLRVADLLLRGELLRTQGRMADALATLREAAAAEDTLRYNEPADWPLPVRTYLGAALLDTGDAAGAARAYREDLTTYPGNGWSLFGLAKAQRASGDAAGAADSERRLAAAWQWADAPLVASRY